MIVQAVNLLDELDAELNNYIMRCREWYSWHFPELGTLLTDNMQFIKTIKIIGQYYFIICACKIFIVGSPVEHLLPFSVVLYLEKFAIIYS